MKQTFLIFKFIWSHPLASKNRIKAFRNFLCWQILQKLHKIPMIYPLVEESVLLIEKGMAGATGNIYTGLNEFTDMAFVLHTLIKDDLFADIGANIGVYTVLAAKNVGAKVFAVEPIPSTFNHLYNNIILNKITSQVTLFPVGIGEKDNLLNFTNSKDCTNHVVLDCADFRKDDIIKIQVKKLDDIFSDHIPVIMKMDIEGYEWPALNGAKKILASPAFKALIIELNGCSISFGFTDSDIHNLLLSFNFKPYAYDPFLRVFTLLNSYGIYNTIYIKDLEWAKKRVAISKKYMILDIAV